MTDFEPLPVAVRVYATREGEEGNYKAPPPRRSRRRNRTTPQRSLVFDTETTTDPSQRLLYGVWRYYVDRPKVLPCRVCVEEGLFHADELPRERPDDYAALADYVAAHRADVFPGRDERLRLLSRDAFVEQVLYRYAWRQHATVVGFNLPFDASRLAIGASPARRRYAGGMSLRLWERERFRLRIAIKSIDSRRHLMGFTAADGEEERFRGHFLDLRTFTFALTDRGHTLESACAAFGVNYRKRGVVHGAITAEHVHYGREDVHATAALYREAVAEFRRHPIALQPTRAFSPASIGKAYLEAM